MTMPDDIAPRKPSRRRWGLWAPYADVILAFAAWSVVWVVVRSQVEDGIVREAASVIHGGNRGGVPGVGGLPGTGLRGVPAVRVERGGTEEVDVVPGATLGAVHSPRPGVGHVWCPVGPCPLYERSGQHDDATVIGMERDTVFVDAGDGSDGAVDERRIPVTVTGME